MIFFFLHFISCDIGYLSSVQLAPPLLPCAVRVSSQRHLCSFLCATVAPYYVWLEPSFSPGHLSRPTNNPQSFKVKRGIVHGWLAVTVNRTFWNDAQRNRVLIPSVRLPSQPSSHFEMKWVFQECTNALCQCRDWAPSNHRVVGVGRIIKFSR